jgi:hypothetical protein
MICVRPRDAAQLGPQLAAVFAAIDSAARAGENQLRVFRIHADGENVGIVNQSRGDRLPVRAAIHGLPGQVRRSGVDGIRVRWIKCERGDVAHFDIVFRRNPMPLFAAVAAAINALRGARGKHPRITGSERQRFNARPAHASHLEPMLPAVPAFVNARVGRLSRIQAGVKVSGSRGIDNQRIKRTGRRIAKRQQPPGCPSVV